MGSDSASWTKCWVAPDRYLRDEEPSYWVRHALGLCEQVRQSACGATDLSSRMLELIANHFCARRAFLIGALAGKTSKVICSSPVGEILDQDPMILDYVFNTGMAVCLLDGEKCPVACVPLRQHNRPRVTGALVLGRRWDTPAFDRSDLELISVFGYGLMSALGGVLHPGATQDEAIARALNQSQLNAAREETETCRRSRVAQPAGTKERPGTRPLTIGALFPGKDFALPDYLDGKD
ncbi:MAG: hypothetical protein R3F62_06975 [Planctomycetota bacterium]